MSAFDKAPVVVISSIDWDAAWQRHQIFAAQFAAAGHRVFFIENAGFRNPGWSDLSRLWAKLVRIARPVVESLNNPIPEGVQIIPPRLLPPTHPLFRRLNEAVLIPQLIGMLRALGLAGRPIVVAYSPTATTVALAEKLSPGALIYDCASNFRGHPMAPPDLPEIEGRLLALADAVVCDSDFLLLQKRSEHADVSQVHQGVSESFFELRPADRPPRSACYYGTWGQDLDPAFLEAAVAAGLEVTVSGFMKGSPPPLPAGVRRLPPAPQDRLVERLEPFDAFLLPYRINRFLLGVVPAKIYECLATGRPVIATPLPSLQPLRDLIYLGHSPEDWRRIISELPRTENEEKRRARVELARRHTHAAEFGRFREIARRRWKSAPAPAPAAPPWWARSGVQSFIEGIGWIGLLYGIARLATLATQVAAGRLFGPIEYGQAHLAIAAAAFLQIAPILGFPTALSKFPSEERSPERQRQLISTALLIFGLWGAAALLALLASGAFLSQKLHIPAGVFDAALALAFCTAFYTVVSSPLLGLRRFAERGVAEALYGLGAPIVLLVLVWRGGARYEMLIVALCAALACAGFFSLWSLRGTLRPRFDASSLRPLLGYTAIGGLSLLTMAFVISPARLLLHKHFAVDMVGVFSAYFTATIQAALALINIASAVLIPLASTREGQRQALGGLRRAWPAVLGAAFTFFIGAAAAALLIFGHRYPFRVDWMALFAAAASLILLHGLLGAVFTARDIRGLGLSAGANIAASVSHLGFAFIFVPLWGVGGAAAALIGGYAVGLLVFAAAIMRQGKMVECSAFERSS